MRNQVLISNWAKGGLLSFPQQCEEKTFTMPPSAKRLPEHRVQASLPVQNTSLATIGGSASCETEFFKAQCARVFDLNIQKFNFWHGENSAMQLCNYVNWSYINKEKKKKPPSLVRFQITLSVREKNNNLAEWCTEYTLPLTVNKSKKLNVDFRKKRKKRKQKHTPKSTSLELMWSGWSISGNQHHRRPVMAITHSHPGKESSKNDFWRKLQKTKLHVKSGPRHYSSAAGEHHW